MGTTKQVIVNLSGYDLSSEVVSYLSEFYSLVSVEEPEASSARVIWTAFAPVTKEVLDRFPQVEIVVCPATGIDHIDENECHRKNVKVLSLRGEQNFLKEIRSTAEHTFGLLLQLCRTIDPPVELSGKRLGILGYGRVGKQVSEIARGFQMRCEPWDPRMNHKADDDNVPGSWLRLLDVLTIHCPLNDETRFMIDEGWFMALPDHAMVINTARPDIIEFESLVSALSRKQIGGYAADFIHLRQSFDSVNSNVVQTNHIAGSTREARNATEMFMAQKLLT